MGKCCGQNNQGGGRLGGPNNAPGTGTGGQCVSANHNELVCHGTNERRRDLMDQVKIFLEEFDDRPCQQTPPQTGPNALKPLGQYPEYMKKHCQSWMPANPRPPLITGISVHETRLTGDVNCLRNDNSEYVSYKDARMKPPTPSCDCAKRNGLQDQCDRPECKPPTAQCLASNPGPCCPPSMGLTRREAEQQGGWPRQQPQQRTQQQQQQQQQQQRTQQQQGCCGNIAQQSQQKPQYVQDQGYGQNQQPAGQGQQFVCFCEAPSVVLPPGKKYLCCPLPQE